MFAYGLLFFFFPSNYELCLKGLEEKKIILFAYQSLARDTNNNFFQAVLY